MVPGAGGLSKDRVMGDEAGGERVGPGAPCRGLWSTWGVKKQSVGADCSSGMLSVKGR